MQKVYLVICIIALISYLTGASWLVEGIAERGFDGVNYGRVMFPLLISGIFFWLFKRTKK